MPFVTEELWQRLPHDGESLMIAPWPQGMDAPPLPVDADATMEGARECQRAGMCAHLSKPFSMNELETLIADVL